MASNLRWNLLQPLLTAMSLVTIVFADQTCPLKCKCHKDTVVDVGVVLNVICTNKGLSEMPDLTCLSGVSLPIQINLDGNEINSISSLDFPAGLNVISINIGENPDMDISEDVFANYATTLKKLSIQAIGLRFDRTLRMFSNLENLEELSISHNNRRGYVKDAVENVEVALFEGPVVNSLKILKMSHDGLKSLSENTLKDLVVLRELDLSNNWFTKVPPVIKNLKTLTKLSLFRCNIDTLENNTFRGLSKLEVIEINTNTLHTIHNHAFKGLEKSLKRLRLERCHLQQIPSDALRELAALEYLDLSQNGFSSASSTSFIGSYCLKELLISAVGMKFEEHMFLGQKNCITELTIKQMQLSVVPREALVVLDKLSRLSLEYNEITVLPRNAFSGIKARSISLANNPLSVIEPGAFDGLPPNLDLNMRRTKMADIDFLLGYPDDAIETVNLDYAELVCRCSMKSSLNATLNVAIYGSCQKGAQSLPLSSSRLEGILDIACAEEAAVLNHANIITRDIYLFMKISMLNMIVFVMYLGCLPV